MNASTFILFATTSALAASHPSNFGFESLDTSWSFFARTPDSAAMTIVSGGCHGGSRCDSLASWGGSDWALTNDSLLKTVVPGEIWNFSAWIKVDSLPGGLNLAFVESDSLGNVVNWNLAPSKVPTARSGWTQYTVPVSIPTGCATIKARFSGWGKAILVFDDVALAKAQAAPAGVGPTTLANDSLRLLFDPISLGMAMRDSILGDTVATSPVQWFSADSARKVGTDSLLVFGRTVPAKMPISIGVRLQGGGVLLYLHGDSATSYLDSLVFPGPVATKAGQNLAMPRGTGITVPVAAASAPWSYTTAVFGDWQVSQGLTGATDGKKGFVVSIDQPWNARMCWQNQGGLLQPSVYQIPSKRVWGQDRSLLIAPLRGGGWAEMGQRHRLRLEQLGGVRTWAQKVKANPKVGALQGAVDFWVRQNWTGTDYRFFDTLRMYGMTRAIVSWNGATAPGVDSLNSWGFLTSQYTQYSGAQVGGTGVLTPEIANGGIVVNADGSTLNGSTDYDSAGNVLAQYKEISIKREVELVRSLVPPDLQTRHRNAQFIDVLLSMNQPEDYNPKYPSTRGDDFAARLNILSFIKDTSKLVVGAEQTRDMAHAEVDWGEGPMSISFPSSAASDWETPVASTPQVDSLSFDPSRRIPLLCLTDHDAFAPTWYTGDGQSKLPARWDDKDAWDALYGTMPLIDPKGRAMWDSLRVRYMRSIHLGAAAHARYGFEKMTGFAPLTSDWKVQKTTFGNGWTATANFDSAQRITGSDTLPGKGFVALNGVERIERSILGGSRRSRVRLSDRWFLDPEGSASTLDGVGTTDAVYMLRQDDTTIQLAMVGNQSSINLLPGSMPWKSSSIRAYPRGSRTPISLAQQSGGWLGLSRVGTNPFYTLHGNFSTIYGYTAGIARLRQGPNPRLLGAHGSATVAWEQSEAGEYQIDVLRADGSTVQSIRAQGISGANRIGLQASHPGILLVRVRTPDGVESLSFPSFR